MPKQNPTTRTIVRGSATAFCLTALLTAGLHGPARAQKVVKGVYAGNLAPAKLVPVAVDPTPPVVRVHSPDVLVTTLQNPNFTGIVDIPADVEWDMSAYREIPLHSGVTLVGERGALGSRPLLYTTKKADEYHLFAITGNDVRIEGLHLRGPAAGDRSSSQPYVHGIGIVEDPEQQLGRQIVITDNEMDEWTGGAVEVTGSHHVRTPQDYDPTWKQIRPEDAGLVRIEGNYLHNNARDGGGYGVVVGGGSYATVEGNVFDYNRHDIASDGWAHCGYVARFNYALEGGFMQGSYYNQQFDVHGSDEGGYGGPAGEYFEIAFNTVRGDQSYYAGLATRPALMLRGRPTMGMFFHDNVLVHDDLGDAVSLKWDTGVSGFFNNGGHDYNFHASSNQFDTDHSTEIAAGDFDGDGHTDVFVATGTAWFFSRGGSQPWSYLQPSSLRTRDLAFADIDNDRSTDVLWRAANGTLYYSKSGKGGPVALTSVPVPASDLRFGDFDGDGRTDIFYTQGGAWNIWNGRTHTWSSPGGSSFPISDLLLGDFDGDGRTDIAGVANGHWSYSSAAAQPWAPMNSKLTNSFAGAVVGDFDGDGRPDIAWNSGGNWYYSAGGRGPSTLLRSSSSLDPYTPLASLIHGQFDGGRRTEFVGFERQLVAMGGFTRVVIGNHLMIWRPAGSAVTTDGNVRDHRGSSAGTGNVFVTLSPQEMR